MYLLRMRGRGSVRGMCSANARGQSQSASTAPVGVAGCSGSWLSSLEDDSPLEQEASSSSSTARSTAFYKGKQSLQR